MFWFCLFFFKSCFYSEILYYFSWPVGEATPPETAASCAHLARSGQRRDSETVRQADRRTDGQTDRWTGIRLLQPFRST